MSRKKTLTSFFQSSTDKSRRNHKINNRGKCLLHRGETFSKACHSLATSPVTLGGCEHIFCSVCCENYLGRCCPVCDLPAHVKDAEVDRQLFNMATLCGRLRDILDEVNGNNGNKDAAVDIYCTPNQGTSNLHIDTSKHNHPVPEPKKAKENESESTKNCKGRRRSTLTPASKGSDKTLTPKDKELINKNEKNVEKVETEEVSSDSVTRQSRTNSRRSSLPETKPKQVNNISSETKIESTSSLVNNSNEENSTSEDIVQKLNKSSELANSKKVPIRTTRQRKSTGTTDTMKESGCKSKVKPGYKQPKSTACDENAETSYEAQDTSNKMVSKSGPVRKKTKKGKTVTEVKAVVNDETADINTSILPDTTNVSETQKLQTPNGKRKLTVLKEASAGCEKSTPTSNKKLLKGEMKTPKLKTSIKDITSPGLNKKNVKGETLLHVAAIKNEVSKVQQLLRDGANPNVRDNAGWTPLHEACNHGYTEVARLLLDHGAMMNVPGFENDSPLHDAVSNNRIDCVRLLVSRGASVTARNLHGLTPGDYAKSQEMKEALQTIVAETLQTKEVIDILEYQQPCLLGTGLSREEKSQLQKTANQLKIKLSEEVTPEVTHIVTKCNSAGMGPRTTKVVQGILSGKWILGMEWLAMCKEMNSLVCEEAFEILGLSMFPDCKSPYKGRMNRKQQLPGLFDGCWFYFNGDFEFSVPPKADLVETIKLGGGKILTREPKPGHLDQNTITVPYHADQDSEIKDCCIFVVFVTGSKFNPIRTKYISSVPSSWVIDCAATFTLLQLPKS